MGDQSSIWKKELTLGRNKQSAQQEEPADSVWKKEIRLGRRSARPAPPVARDDDFSPAKRLEQWQAPRQPKVDEVALPAAVEVPAAQPVAKIAARPDVVAATPPRSFAALDPRFRQITVLAKLVEERAAEYPGRVDEWRQMLPRLAEQAEDGLLPIALEGVVRTLFYELLHVGPNAPSGVERAFETPAVPAVSPAAPKRQRLKRARRSSEQPVEQASEPAVKPAESGLRRELHLPRPKFPKRSKPQALKVTIDQELAPSPVKPEQSGLRRELHLPRPKLPKLSRGVRPERPEKVEQAEKPAKAAKAPKEQKSGLQRELRLPRPKLPTLTRGTRVEKPAKPEKQAKSAQPKQAGLRRDLSMPSFKLPKLNFSLRRRGSGRSTQGTEKLVGLRIGSSQLAAALVHNNGSAELLQLARSPLDTGVVVGGEVRDSEALARSLKAFFREHKLPQDSVRVGISNNRIGVRMLEVPVIEDPVQFENALRFRMQEVLPIPIAEAVVDHVTLDQTPNADGMIRVLVVFAHKDLVEGYVDACRRAGLKLAGIDLDAFALLRALSEPPIADAEAGEPDKRTALVAVAIGHERTIFAVSDGHICDFTRVLEWGGVWLDTALEKALDLSPEQAAEIKHSLSLSSNAAPDGLSPVQAEVALSALRHELQVLGRELLSSLQFYQSRPGSLDIGEILLSGGGAQLEGIDAELSRALGVPVRLGDALGRVTLGKNVVRPAESGSLAIAVGLAIEDQH